MKAPKAGTTSALTTYLPFIPLILTGGDVLPPTPQTRQALSLGEIFVCHISRYALDFTLLVSPFFFFFFPHVLCDIYIPPCTIITIKRTMTRHIFFYGLVLEELELSLLALHVEEERHVCCIYVT